MCHSFNTQLYNLCFCSFFVNPLHFVPKCDHWSVFITWMYLHVPYMHVMQEKGHDFKLI